MEKLLKKFLNGTCTPEEFDVLVQYFRDNNKDEVFSLQFCKIWQDAMNNEDTRHNEELIEKVHLKITEEKSELYRKKYLVIRRLLRVASIVILILLVSFFFHYKNTWQASQLSIYETISTPHGAKTSIKLPDGTLVFINSGSNLSYNRNFGKSREVQLSGQAYFNVSAKVSPFVVKTPYAKIEAKGTSFDVKAFLDDEFETTLVEGSVEINSYSNEKILLEPGQQAILDTTNKFVVKNVNTDLYTSWKDGKLIFINEPFLKVAKQLERWYNVKIEITGESLKNLGYTGKIEMETFSEVLELINITTPIQYKFDKDTRTLRISGQ